MGGILSAEVVLKPSNPPHKRPLFNKVLGTINFDVPFLGMHPGVVISGLGSLFRKEDSTQDDGFKSPSPNQVMMPMPAGQFDLGQSPNNSALLSKTSSQTNSTSFVDSDRASRSVSQLSVPVDDPNYNPRFENDVVRPVRKGWESAFHFMTKHSGNLWQATQTYVTSHVEFGGTMADYPKLYARYKRVRALEDVKDARNSTSGPPRVRFVNFYTASTGLPKSAPSSTRGRQLGPNDEQQPGREQSISSTATSTRIVRSIENSDNILASIETNESDPIEPIGPSSDQKDEDQPTDVSQEGANTSGHSFTQAQEGEEKEGLPPIPPVPTQPTDFDQTHYQDKDILKLAQKDHARQTKAYQSALKNREKAITERKKLLEKRTKKAAKELEKASKEREKATKEKEKARLIKSQTLSPSSTVSKDNAEDKDGEKKTEKEREKSRKPARDRKFCITPSKQNGIRDATWIRVFMTGVDEVGAHCGLFFAEREHYEGLIQTVAELVREWVLNDMSVRLR